MRLLLYTSAILIGVPIGLYLGALAYFVGCELCDMFHEYADIRHQERHA